MKIRVGFVGLGKLGMPIALVMARKHDVVGYDVSPTAAEILRTRVYPHREEHAQEYLEETTLRVVGTVDEVVQHADIVFIVVQTPHGALYEGVTRLPETRADFDYSYLREAVKSVVEAAQVRKKRVVACVMSTVLPGTMAREVKPLLNEYTPLCYSPAFPAMGTAIRDYENPEFVLLGVDDLGAADAVREFYQTFIRADVVEMSVASAEATKVFYNSFISMKIGLANTWMQVCHEVGANVDDVVKALGKATNRIVSPKYMKGGMGDAGMCHPRDNIALSWLSRRLGMGYDLFGDVMRTREAQTEWLGNLCVDEAKRRGLQRIIILGKAFKAGTALTGGSCATLLANLLAEHAWVKDAGHTVEQWDPHVDPPRSFSDPAVFVVATNHEEFYQMTFPVGSVVVDPWGRMPDMDGVAVVRVGRA